VVEQPRKLHVVLLLVLVGPVVLDVLVGVVEVLALLVDVLVSLVDVLVSLVEPEVVLLVPGSVFGPQPRARAASTAELRSARDRRPVTGTDGGRESVVKVLMGCIEHRRYSIVGIGAGYADAETCRRGCRPGDECDRARSSDAD
jgi:hypothetical protein